MIVEIPKGHRNKFEVDKESGLIALNRCLYSSSHYPGDYGFIPQTLAEDGDALDALVMVSEATFPGCLIRARVLGMFQMTDSGDRDCKLLCVPNGDPLYGDYHELKDAPSHFLREVENFFSNYKQLEGGEIVPLGWVPAGKATDELNSSILRFRDAQSELPGFSDHQDCE